MSQRGIVIGLGKEQKNGQTHYFRGDEREATLIRQICPRSDYWWVRYDGETATHCQKLVRMLPPESTQTYPPGTQQAAPAHSGASISSQICETSLEYAKPPRQARARSGRLIGV